MKILKIQTLRGPNYWSIRHHNLIVMRLDLEGTPPSNQIPGFYDGLVKTLPSLVEHYCSPGKRGGFLSRVTEGTMMGHIIEHVALELQELAGMPVGFGRTRETATEGVYQVVFAYIYEQAGRYAARAAVRLCQSIIDTGSYPDAELNQDLKDLLEIAQDASLGPSTETLIKEAESRKIPWQQLSARAMIQLGYGIYQKRIQATLSDLSGILAVELACDKQGTKQILKNAGVPVPRGTVIQYLSDLEAAIAEVGGYPIVIKPLDGNHGRGITIDINSYAEAEIAYDAAKNVSKSVIVERYHHGRDHRVLVINGRLAAVAERIPARVQGDGKSTIAELVDQTNQDPNRGEGHANILTKITIDRASIELLEKQGYTLDSILPAGEFAYLRATANLSTGGIAVDRTDDIHPENIWLAERVARIIGLDIMGIDVVTPDITQPLRLVDGVVVEVNAAPGFRMHTAPSIGKPRNVAAPVMDMLFPPGRPCRIPIISITGTNGKTTTTRLIAHIYQQSDLTVGYTTTDGIYINGHLVEPGDNTGPQSAAVILQDPTVELAVLETARGGILRSGLAFDHCDVGVVLNVAADHLGLGDIDTIDQMAHLKSVVAETASSYAVLNGDDPRVATMAERVSAQVAYFSLQPEVPLIQKHIAGGGLAAVYSQGEIVLWGNGQSHTLAKAADIPITLGAKAAFQIANVLAASLAAYAQGLAVEYIQTGLLSFQASIQQTPGRMNFFDVKDFHVLIDYAHNPASYEALGGFIRNWNGKKIGVIGGPGDRRNQDLVDLGKLAAQIFDQIIVKEDDDKRGRPMGDAAHYICQGILEANAKASYETILNEIEAIKQGLSWAVTGALVVVLPESVNRAIKLIEAYADGLN